MTTVDTVEARPCLAVAYASRSLALCSQSWWGATWFRPNYLRQFQRPSEGMRFRRTKENDAGTCLPGRAALEEQISGK
ncbi:hypothetical protein E2C01_093149 [Portunus trituberculatus]|uniref:Uncharacterized protein n=1 Tax=Portunus trituberculatus TaxID=210409 RepID=A0A5B7JZS3_PORTR|nr:hypothetical protein [Portunus trituberculatus]